MISELKNKEKNNRYEIVTEGLYKKVSYKGSRIIFDKQFIDKKGTIHPIAKMETAHIIIKNSNNNEIRIAKLLKKKFGGHIHLVPRITDNNCNTKTSTPDYIWDITGKNEYWELKTPEGNKKKYN